MKRPSFQFYPTSWLADTQLNSCSLAAQGLWMRIMCHFHQSERYGHSPAGWLSDSHELDELGTRMRWQAVSRAVGVSKAQLLKYTEELLTSGVISINEDGAVYSRRMERDEEIRRVRAEAGSKGGKTTRSKTEYVGTGEQGTDKKSRTTRSMKKAMPEGFAPDATALRLAGEMGLDVEAEFVQFVDYHKGRGSTMCDWQAALRTWLRKAHEIREGNQQRRRLPSQAARPSRLGTNGTSPVASPGAKSLQVDANDRRAIKFPGGIYLIGEDVVLSDKDMGDPAIARSMRAYVEADTIALVRNLSGVPKRARMLFEALQRGSTDPVIEPLSEAELPDFANGPRWTPERQASLLDEPTAASANAPAKPPTNGHGRNGHGLNGHAGRPLQAASSPSPAKPREGEAGPPHGEAEPWESTQWQ